MKMIKLLLSLRFFQTFSVMMAVIVIYFQSLGLSTKEIFALQAIFAIALVALEVISGYFADTFGRVLSIRIGTIATTIGWMLYFLASGFWTLALAEIVLAIGSAAMSGSDSALLFETLKEKGKEQEFKKYQGRIFSIGTASGAIAAIIGGFIVKISFEIGLLAEIIISLGAVALSFALIESAREERAQGSIEELFKTVKGVFLFAEVRRLLLYGSIISSATLAGVWFYQLYLQEAGVNIAYFGFFWAALQLSGTLTGLLTHKIESWIGIKKGLQLLVILIFLGYLGASISMHVLGVLFFLFFGFARGLNRTLLEDSIQQLIHSKTRATILSITSMLTRVLFAGIGVLLGIVVDVQSLQIALMVSGIVFASLAIIAKRI